MAKPDWPNKGQVLTLPKRQDWTSLKKAKSYPHLYGKARLTQRGQSFSLT